MDSKEARYVVRLAHTGIHSPSDQSGLLSQVRDRVRPLGATAMNLRVSPKALEFDLFCPSGNELHPLLTAVEPLGTILTYKRLDAAAPAQLPGQVIAEARTLFNEQRFWEVHEVLEGLWKKSKGPEKQLLQGLILTAAAMVHVQKNEMTVVLPMLEDAARRLTDQPATFYGLDLRHFLRALKKVILTQQFHFPTI